MFWVSLMVLLLLKVQLCVSLSACNKNAVAKAATELVSEYCLGTARGGVPWGLGVPKGWGAVGGWGAPGSPGFFFLIWLVA